MIESQTSVEKDDSDIEEESGQPAQRHQDKKQHNPLEDLEKLSRFVYKLNYTDTTSEDYVYYQIILHLAEKGSFTVTELDKKIKFYKKTKRGPKMIKIERRKLKQILEGTKEFSGLIPLNYVRRVPEEKHRGGKQENTYYLTEKGIIASIGFYSYKKNINIKKILIAYEGFGGKYQRFIREFIKLQIQVYLAYYYVHGLSLAFKKETDAEYDEFRQKIIDPFEIKIADNYLEKQFRDVLAKFNVYRIIHLKLHKAKAGLGLLWGESSFIEKNDIPLHGFSGWYQIQFLTKLDANLKQKKYNIKRKIPTTDKPNKGIAIELVSGPEFLYSLFQEDSNAINPETVENTMRLLKLV